MENLEDNKRDQIASSHCACLQTEVDSESTGFSIATENIEDRA